MMGEKGNILSISLVAFVLLILLSQARGRYLADGRFDPNYNPHDFIDDSGACPRCHYVDERGTMDETGFIPQLVDFCHECHTVEDLGRSHPIGVDPTDVYWRLRLPDDFYLDTEHNMTCITCHKGHGKYLSTEKTFPFQKPVNPDAEKWGEPYYYKTYYVRRSDPEKGYAVMCNECHEGYLE
ncbi:MAG: hypothetical protein D6713_07605 [Deltaproteobacteria bacterium]|nr:MAG: hypothetical protein D6713_07605 [Deltaproteobacteria bacterium]